jgi:hypothetical protein
MQVTDRRTFDEAALGTIPCPRLTPPKHGRPGSSASEMQATQRRGRRATNGALLPEPGLRHNDHHDLSPAPSHPPRYSRRSGGSVRLRVTNV